VKGRPPGVQARGTIVNRGSQGPYRARQGTPAAAVSGQLFRVGKHPRCEGGASSFNRRGSTGASKKGRSGALSVRPVERAGQSRRGRFRRLENPWCSFHADQGTGNPHTFLGPPGGANVIRVEGETEKFRAKASGGLRVAAHRASRAASFERVTGGGDSSSETAGAEGEGPKRPGPRSFEHSEGGTGPGMRLSGG